jgi:hypothetical protein
MPTAERDHMRKVFFDAWNKHQAKKFLEPLENQIVEIILQHPQYHEFFSHPDNFEQDHFQEQNPFMHISLHLALHEQISTDRPAGIKAIYSKLCFSLQNSLVVEHKMMDCLASILWDAQTVGKMPDEKVYLEMLLRL